MKNISSRVATCLLVLAFCGCGASDDNKIAPDADARHCAGNLRSIDAAKKHWAQEHNAALTDTPTMDDLEPYWRHGLGKCPNGGTYTIGKVSDLSQCSIPAHNEYYKANLPPPVPAAK